MSRTFFLYSFFSKSLLWKCTNFYSKIEVTNFESNCNKKQPKNFSLFHKKIKADYSNYCHYYLCSYLLYQKCRFLSSIFCKKIFWISTCIFSLFVAYRPTFRQCWIFYDWNPRIILKFRYNAQKFVQVCLQVALWAPENFYWFFLFNYVRLCIKNHRKTVFLHLITVPPVTALQIYKNFYKRRNKL